MNALVWVFALALNGLPPVHKPDVAMSRKHFDQAQIFASMLDYRRAIEEYQKAYEANPSRVWFLFNIARLSHRLAGMEPDFVLRRGYLQRSLEGFEYYLDLDDQVTAQQRKEALAEMEEVRKDLAKVDEDEKRAVQKQAEEAVERERERKRMQALEQEKQEMVERNRALGEKLQRLDAQMAEMKGAEERRRARRRVQLRLGLPLIATGLASVAVGIGLTGQSSAIAAEVRSAREPNPTNIIARLEQRHRFDLAAGILIGVGGMVSTGGLVSLCWPVNPRHSTSAWLTVATNGIAIGGSFQ